MSWRAHFTLALRLFRRELITGELTLLFVALLVAVTAVTSVAFFTNRVERALLLEANRLLAADLVISADHPPPQNYIDIARENGLDHASAISFPSMVVAEKHSQLTTLKAVSSTYPLRGEVKIIEQGAEKEGRISPIPGTVWADSRLLSRLKLEVGDMIQLGKTQLKISAELVSEPDAAFDFYNVLPRIMLNNADLQATGLIQEGSRARWKLLLAGESASVQKTAQTLAKQLTRGEKIEDIKEARPEMKAALERANRFLGLTALLAVSLAAVAMVLACQRYIQRHYPSVALLRCLGATQRDILTLFLSMFAVLTFAAGGAGVVLGWLAQNVIITPLAGVIGQGMSLPPAGATPWLTGFVTGFILLFGFALPPLLALRATPTLRVLRKEIPHEKVGYVAYLCGGSALLGLMLWQANDLRLTATIAAGFIAFVALSAVATDGILRLAQRLPAGRQLGWRFGLANLVRRRTLSIVQIVALASGLMALLTLSAIRGDLLDAWQQRLPEKAPNHFILNIQPNQLDALANELALQGLEVPEFSPMIRGRLIAINKKQIQPDSYADENTQRLAEREFNLSTRDTLPSDNQIVAGSWWEKNTTNDAFSVESGIAKKLGIDIGDELTFQIAGNEYKAKVRSLRKVDWDSFNVNFFVLATPPLLEDLPSSHIASFYLPSDQEETITLLLKKFPNLTIIDVTALLGEVRNVIDKLVIAIQSVFGFSVLAGGLVLWAAMLCTHDERAQDAAILRTLGASRRQITTISRAEFTGIGLLSGVLAALGTAIFSAVIGSTLFDLPWTLSLSSILFGVFFGLFAVTLASRPSVKRLLKQAPLSILNKLD